jgi:hypothetical protein
MKTFDNFMLQPQKIRFLFFMILLSFAAFAASVPVSANSGKAAFEPRAAFGRMWVDYNITQNQQNGMLIHVNFTVYDLKATDCQLRILFQDSAGKPLRDKNKRYFTTAGDVLVYNNLKPAYNPAVYNDYTLFMPYSELDLPDGNYNLKMDVDLTYADGQIITHLTTYDFEYKQGSTKPRLSYGRTWVDYDVTEKGQFGMVIHTKFSLTNLKGVDSRLVIYFDRLTNPNTKTYTRLKSPDNRFQRDGNVAAEILLKPGFDVTEYNDLKVFIPYNELHLTTGEHSLKMDIDIIYENGELIEHLAFYEFEYWKK